MEGRVVSPLQGRHIALGGMGVVFKVTGEDTSGALSIVEHPIEPGRLVPPHVHQLEDELSYVVEGQIGVRIRDEELEVDAGSYVLKPRGVPHTFWNAGPEPARVLEIIYPAGFERFFEDLGINPARSPGELASSYRIEYVRDWIPDLASRYGLRLIGG